jgi:hypothetical protein
VNIEDIRARVEDNAEGDAVFGRDEVAILLSELDWLVRQIRIGHVFKKSAIREILTRLIDGWYSLGELGIEQATNRILRLQRPPINMEEIALTVCCPYCGRTPGNPCRRSGIGELKTAHPSRIKLVLTKDKT